MYTPEHTGRSPLSLPLEIRQHIFSYLSPPSGLATIVRSRHLGVSSVSHRPPPVNALLTCRQVYYELLDVYYRRCVFKIEGLLDPDNTWPLWQMEEVLQNSALGKATLSRMRNIELNLFWHRLPEDYGGMTSVLSDPESIYADRYESETDKRVERLERAVRVIACAPQLRSVIVTWKEIPDRPGEDVRGWHFKARVLKTIGHMRGVRIRPGDIVARDETEVKIAKLLKDMG